MGRKEAFPSWSGTKQEYLAGHGKPMQLRKREQLGTQDLEEE